VAPFLIQKNKRGIQYEKGVETMSGVHLEYLEVARLYLFGEVRFLHFLLLLMGLDILTGLFNT